MKLCCFTFTAVIVCVLVCVRERVRVCTTYIIPCACVSVYALMCVKAQPDLAMHSLSACYHHVLSFLSGN